VQPGEPRGRPVHESVAGGGYDIGQLQEWPFHLFLAGTVFRVRGRREGERVEWAGGRFEMALRQVQVTAGRLQIGVAQQQLNGTQICTGFEQVGSEAVSEGVRVDAFVEPCPRGCLVHGIPNALGCHGDIAVGLTALAREQVSCRFALCHAPVVAQFLEQPRAQHDIAVLLALALTR